MADPDRHPDAGASRPWEQEGAVRRDAAPHRAGWLLLCGASALACGILAMLFTVAFSALLGEVSPTPFAALPPGVRAGVRLLPLLAVVLALSGLAFGGLGCLLAELDLVSMRAGRMDVAGRPCTEKARWYSVAGIGFGLLSLLLCAFLA
jgi:hypothetical protein